jgi:hypothetical protein
MMGLTDMKASKLWFRVETAVSVSAGVLGIVTETRQAVAV